MKIQVNTDSSIEGHEKLIAQVSKQVEKALIGISGQITRVEAHLSDENGDKSGKNDKRCMLEARLEGYQPIAVTDQAATMEFAVDGAANKLARLIQSTVGRRHHRMSQQTDPPLPESKLPTDR